MMKLVLMLNLIQKCMYLVPGMWDQEYYQAERERREEEKREERRKKEKRRRRGREDIHCNLKRYSSEHHC